MAYAETTGEQEQPFKYNGKELDREMQLNTYDYAARYMDPAIGRFTSVDPLAELHYNSSPYAYVLNNPLKYIDPNGCDTIYAFKDGTEFDRIIAEGEDVIIYGPSAETVIEGTQSSTSYNLFAYGLGLNATGFSAYAGQRYTGSNVFRQGYFQTSRGNFHSLSVLQPQANGQYVRGVQGLRYGALYARKSANIPGKIGTGMSYISLGLTGYNFVNNPTLTNGFDVGVSITGIVYWEAAVAYMYIDLVASPNIKQIQENIKNGSNPLNGTVNPTTGEYYVPGYFSGFGF